MSDGLVKKNFLIVENKNIQKLSFREIKDLKILLPQLNINTVNLQTWPGPDLNDSTWDLRDARPQTSRTVDLIKSQKGDSACWRRFHWIAKTRLDLDLQQSIDDW